MTPTGKLEQKMKSLITLVTDGWKVKRILTYDNGLTIISDLTCSFLAAVTAAVINCLQFHLARVYTHTHTHTHYPIYTTARYQTLGCQFCHAHCLRVASQTVQVVERISDSSVSYEIPCFSLCHHNTDSILINVQ